MKYLKIEVPLTQFCLYCAALIGCYFLFKFYYTECKESLLEKNHLETGYVNSRKKVWQGKRLNIRYKIEVTSADGYISVHNLTSESKYIEDAQVGSKVTLRISDDYPKLRDVIDWKE